jgi:hypothetical protein
MNKRVLFAASAALLANSFLTMPALAVVPALHDTTGMTPQEVCDAQLRPNNPNSDFLTAPQNVSVGGWVNVGVAYADTSGDPISEEGFGTPTHSNVILADGYYRNGGSPNVWAGATATATYPQTRQEYPFLQDASQTTTFDCKVWKDPGGPDHGPDEVVPPGLQSYGNTSVETDTVDAGTGFVISEDDYIVEGETVYALICISPNNVTKGKPGTWTGKHGFDAANCPAASIAAGTNFIPSGNAPTL